MIFHYRLDDPWYYRAAPPTPERLARLLEANGIVGEIISPLQIDHMPINRAFSKRPTLSKLLGERKADDLLLVTHEMDLHPNPSRTLNYIRTHWSGCVLFADWNGRFIDHRIAGNQYELMADAFTFTLQELRRKPKKKLQPTMNEAEPARLFETQAQIADELYCIWLKTKSFKFVWKLVRSLWTVGAWAKVQGKDREWRIFETMRVSTEKPTIGQAVKIAGWNTSVHNGLIDHNGLTMSKGRIYTWLRDRDLAAAAGVAAPDLGVHLAEGKSAAAQESLSAELLEAHIPS